MICCKIIADYNNPQGSFDKLCDLLGKRGSWMWNSGAMYFADTEGTTEEKQVIQCVKKAGYTKYFIDIFDEKNEPLENDVVYGWIAGNVAKITCAKFETQNREILLQTKEGLNQIEKELDSLIEKAVKEMEQNKSNTAEDKN